jgi:isopenicillin N synthase-like dioxygenase
MSILLPENAFETLKLDGFLLLKIPEALANAIRDVFSLAYRFFRGSFAEKSTSSLPSDLGYRALAGEYSQSPTSPDQYESFSASARMTSALTSLQSITAKDLYSEMLDVIREFEPIAELITSRIAKEIDSAIDGESFYGAFHLWSFLQMNYARPSSTKAEFINDLHEDGCLLTIACPMTPGLEIRTVGGQFIRVTTEPDEILVFPGEILWLLSGGALLPLHHRVKPNANYKERLSLLYFADIDPRLCRPWCVSEINKTVDIGQRVRQNPTRFGLAEWDWE